MPSHNVNTWSGGQKKSSAATEEHNHSTPLIANAAGLTTLNHQLETRFNSNSHFTSKHNQHYKLPIVERSGLKPSGNACHIAPLDLNSAYTNFLQNKRYKPLATERHDPTLNLHNSPHSLFFLHTHPNKTKTSTHPRTTFKAYIPYDYTY